MRGYRYATTLAVLAVVLAACNPQPPKTATEPTAGPSVSPSASPLSLRITGHGTAKAPIRIVQQQGNRKQYQLQASSYESHGSAGKLKALFQSVHVTFYAKDGTIMNADAPRADVNESANTVTLEGGVHARNSAGMTLACDQLVYSRTTEMVHGTGHVVITDPNGMRATGSRFDSDISLTHTTMQ
jgi:LPS export ABC transporter protein LptC